MKQNSFFLPRSRARPGVTQVFAPHWPQCLALPDRNPDIPVALAMVLRADRTAERRGFGGGVVDSPAAAPPPSPSGNGCDADRG